MLQYEIKKRYNLCIYCLYRQLAPTRNYNGWPYRKINAAKNPPNSCYICQGLMSQLDPIIQKHGSKYENRKTIFVTGGVPMGKSVIYKI